jgi:2-keto-3-deoxy-L-rhamnonate aldolase RhmA
MVNTAEQACAAVSACRYGQRGIRSLGPTRRSLSPDPEALEARVSCFVMIETAEAVANLDEICAVPGLAGVYLGSADLSLSMGEPLFVLPSLPFLREVDREIVKACRKAGIIAGAHAGPMERTKELIDDGFQLLTLGLDWLYVRSGITADLATVSAYLASR